MWLVVVDTTQIQPYIFGSNRLRENVGASYLVDAATRTWAFESVTEAVKDAAPGKTNIGPENTLKGDAPDARIENGDMNAEVLYAGGGNFVVLFDDKDRAKKFQYHLSRRALVEAPGLQLVIAQKEINWQEDVLSKKLHEVFDLLTEKKMKRVWSAPLLGLSVTAACRSTGLPATDVTEGIGQDPGYLASDDILAKVAVAKPQQSNTSEADRRLQEVLPLAAGYRYPSDFEDMGATAGEYSHIAVVHADGNGMGQRFREIGKTYTTADENRECVLKLREFSSNVENAAKKALKAVIDKLLNRVDDEHKVIVHQLSRNTSIQIKLKRKDNAYYIPFRPIVFGGDDVTFVCDGRLGLSLALIYLREFEKYTARAELGKNGGGLTACAGVSIVKSHYPFARAYGLAKELTESAKSYRKNLYREYHYDADSCLDWHFALSGLSGSIEEIRDREYKTKTGDLTLRPVTLEANPKQRQHAWPVIREGISAFQQEEWMERRNKIKALRDALREGPQAVEHFLVAFNKGNKLPPVLSEMQDWPRRGWHGNSCGYFDAIELVDWFVPLEGVANATTTAPVS